MKETGVMPSLTHQADSCVSPPGALREAKGDRYLKGLSWANQNAGRPPGKAA